MDKDKSDAESHAQVESVFEKNRQEYIAQIEADAKREIDKVLLSPPAGRWYHVAGSILFLGGIFGMVMPFLGMSRTFRDVGWVMFFLGIGCWMVRDWKQHKRTKNLPPPQ